MRIITLVLTAAALAGLTSSTPSALARLEAPSAPATPGEQAPERSAVGTLERVDTKAQQITVATPSDHLVFHLQDGATIRQGSKTLKPSELTAHTGERIKVRYRESGGERKAHWIVIAVPARRPPNASR